MFTFILLESKIWKSVHDIMAKGYPNEGNLEINIIILTHIKLSIPQSFRRITYLFDSLGIEKKYLAMKGQWL